MKAARLILNAAILSGVSVPAFGQAFIFTPGNLTYSENFDSMGASGTTYVAGWDGARVGGTGTIGAPLSPLVGSGGGNQGIVYNFGSAGSDERALGTLGSGTTHPAFGASFVNNTGSTIVELDLNAFAEQWRSGSSATANETVRFEYSFDAASVSTGAWTPVAELNLNEILTTTTVAAAVDGNSNRTAISKKIIVSWTAGTTMWIRWRDEDDPVNDGGYALDDLTFKVGTGSPPKSIVWNPPGTNWNTTDTNWLNLGAAASFATGDVVLFDDAGLAGSTITVQPGGVNPGAVIVANTSGTYTFTGGAIGGSGTLTKDGAGTLVLQTSYANAIGVQAGALITQGANLLADAAGLSVGGGARVELDAGGETIGQLTLSGGELKTNGTVTLNDNIIVNGAAQSSAIRGTVALGAANRTITLVNAATLDLEAVVAGSTRLTLAGAGIVRLMADNAASYSGNVQLNSGDVTLVLGTAGSLGSSQFFYNTGTLTATAAPTPLVIANPVSLGNTASAPTIGAGRDFEFTGPWSFFQTAAKTLVVNNNTVISGTISGTGAGSSLTIRGSGRLTIAGANNSFTALGVDGAEGGTVEFNGNVDIIVPPLTDVVNGGRLTGNGTLGDLNVLTGIVAPGTLADPTATLSVGNLNLLADGDLAIEFGGTAATDYDRLNVTGAVTLAGDLVLTLTAGFVPSAADGFTIILNDGGDAVNGEFTGLPDGTKINVGGVDLELDYNGGDGNDVTLGVPEPSSAVLLLGALAVFAGRRRSARPERA